MSCNTGSPWALCITEDDFELLPEGYTFPVAEITGITGITANHS